MLRYSQLKTMRSHHTFCNYTASNTLFRKAMPWFSIVLPSRRSRRKSKTLCCRPLKLLRSGNPRPKSDSHFIRFASHYRGYSPNSFGSQVCKSLKMDGRCSCTLSMNARWSPLCLVLYDRDACQQSAHFSNQETCRCKITQRHRNIGLVGAFSMYVHSGY